MTITTAPSDGVARSRKSRAHAPGSGLIGEAEVPDVDHHLICGAIVESKVEQTARLAPAAPVQIDGDVSVLSAPWFRVEILRPVAEPELHVFESDPFRRLFRPDIKGEITDQTELGSPL